MTKNQKIIFAVVIVLAVFFRYYQITAMPGGLFPDEAANGLDINLMEQGHLQPFYERGNGREALFFYLIWGSVSVFGRGPWQHHIVSAFIGVLSVVMCFFAARKLFSMDIPPDDPRGSPRRNRAAHIALLAAFLMAVSSWHVVLSRTAFRAVMIPLFTSLTFYFLLCAYGAGTLKKRLWFGFLTGAAFAGGFYTYIAFRIMAPILFILILWPLALDIFSRPRFTGLKRFWKPALMAAAGFLLVIYPIGKYFWQHPDSFIGRAGQVSVFNPNLYTIDGAQLTGKPPLGDVAWVALEVLKKQFLAFFTHGDLNWRQNVSGYPFLSPLISPFFGVCLAVVTVLAAWYLLRAPKKRASWWKYALLAGWFWGMMLPVVTTAEGIPHGLRGIGVIPAVFIISALGLYTFGNWMWRLHEKLYAGYTQNRRYRLASLAVKSLVPAFALALVLQTYFAYFVYAANSPENFYYFRSDLTPVSDYLKKFGSKSNTYLVLDKFSVQTADYLTTVDGAHPENPKNQPYVQVDPENSWELPRLAAGSQVVFTQSSIFDTAKFKQYHPEARLALEYRNKFGQAIMAVYKAY